MRTKNCIICKREAVIYTGHVKKGNKKITAGFCITHKKDSETLPMTDGPGCYGEFKNDFGIITEDFAL